MRLKLVMTLLGLSVGQTVFALNLPEVNGLSAGDHTPNHPLPTVDDTDSGSYPSSLTVELPRNDGRVYRRVIVEDDSGTPHTLDLTFTKQEAVTPGAHNWHLSVLWREEYIISSPFKFKNFDLNFSDEAKEAKVTFAANWANGYTTDMQVNVTLAEGASTQQN